MDTFKKAVEPLTGAEVGQRQERDNGSERTMRLETEVKNCEEQLDNALKRRSAQFHKNKKPRFVNTQTSPTCLSPKRKNKRNVQAVPSRLACHRGWPQRQKAMKMSAVPSQSGAAAKCQSQEFHPLAFKFKRVPVFTTFNRLHCLDIGYSLNIIQDPR